MPNNVEERVVEMRFDNGQFEKNAKESISTLQKLKQALNLDGAKKGLEDVSKAASSFTIDNMVKNISDGIDQINSRYGILGRVVQNVKDDIANSLTSLATQTVQTISSLSGLSQWAQEMSSATGLIAKSIQEMSPAANMGAGWDKYAQKTTAVQTIMNATGKSIEEVEGQLSELMWFSDETSYSFTDMTSNVGKFTSQNIDLETSVKAMMGIANAAALAGANSTEASRAMYNISQAMGAGYMKLIDWKSIENANMATSQFKESMIEAGVAAGTLIDLGDGLYETLKGNEVSVSNFTSNLADGWLTSEAMLDALQNYGDYADIVFQKATEEGLTCAEAMEALGDEYDELGVRAFKAAQEAKTFADMVEATKDAVSSQWSKIFQEIFGNYEKARKIWTWWANEFYELFADPLWDVADMFKEWHQNGGFWEATEAIRLGWTAIKDVIYEVEDAWRTILPKNSAFDFLESTKQARENMQKLYDYFHGPKVAVDFLDEYNSKLEEMGYSAEQALDDADLADILSKTEQTFLNYYEDLDDIAESYYQGDKEKAAHALAVQYLKDAQREYEMANKAMEPSIERTDKLHRSVEGLASAVDIVKQALGAFKSQLIDPLLKQLPKAVDWILDHTANIGDKIQEFSNKLRKNKTFENFFANIREKITTAYNAVKEFVKRAKELDSVKKLLGYLSEFKDWLKGLPLNILDKIREFFHGIKEETGGFSMDDAVNAFDWIIQKLNGFIENVRKYWPSIVEFATGLAEKLEAAGKAAYEFFTGPDWAAATEFIHDLFGQGWSDLTSTLETIGNWFQTFIEEKIKNGELKQWGKDGAKTVFEGIQEFFQETDWLGMLKNLAVTGFIAKIADSIMKIFDNMAKASKGWKEVPEAIVNVLGSVGGVLKGMKHDLNATAMLKVAGAIAILVAAIWALGILPEQMLARATASILIIGGIIALIITAMAKYKAADAQQALAKATTVFDALQTFAQTAGLGMQRMLQKLGTAAVIKSIGKVFLSIALGFGIIIGALLLLNKYGGGANNIKRLIDVLMPLFTGIAGLVILIAGVGAILTGQNKSLWSLAETLEQAGKTFLRIAASMLVIAVAFNIMAKLDPERLEMAATYLAGAIGIMMLVTMLLMVASLGADSERLDTVGKTMIKMAGSLILVSIALALLTRVANPDKLMVAAGALAIVAVAMAAIIAALAFLVKFTGKNTTEGAENIQTLSVSLLAMAGAIFILAAGVSLMTKAGVTIKDVAIAIGAFIVVLAALVLAALAIEKLNIAEGLQTLSIALLALGGMFTLIGVGTLAFAAGLALLAKNSEAIPGIFQAIAEGIVLFNQTIAAGEGGIGTFIVSMLVVAVAAAAVGYAITKIVQGMTVVLQAMEPFLAKLAEQLPKIKTLLIGGAALLIVGLLEYLSGSMGTLVDTVLKLILQAINAIAEGIINNSYAFGGALRNVIVALVHLLVEGLGSMFGVPQELIEKFLGTDFWTEDIEEQMSGLKDGIDSNLKELRDSAGGLVGEINQNLGNIGSGVSTTNAVTQVKTNNNYGTKAQALMNERLEKNGTSKAGKNASEDFFDSFMSTAEGYTSSSEFPDYMAFMGDAGTDGFLDSFNVQDILNSADIAGGEGAATFGSYAGLWQSSGEDLGEGGEQGVASKEGDIDNTSRSIAKSGADSMDMPAYYYKSGQNNVLGYIRGIQSQAEAAAKAGGTIATNALNRLKAEQEERSPSKATRRSGVHFVQGFINGIKATADGVYKTVEEVGGGAVDTMAATIASAKKLLSGDVDIDPTIRPVLDLTDINSGFASMNRLFTGYTPKLGYAGVGNIPNVGSLSAVVQNSYSNDDVVSAIKDLRGDISYLGEEMGKMQLVLDSGALVGATTKQMDRSLGRVASYKARGN